MGKFQEIPRAPCGAGDDCRIMGPEGTSAVETHPGKPETPSHNSFSAVTTSSP